MELDNPTAEVQNENTASKSGLGVALAASLVVIGSAAGFFLGRKRGIHAGRNAGASREDLDSIRERMDALDSMVKTHTGTANEAQA